MLGKAKKSGRVFLHQRLYSVPDHLRKIMVLAVFPMFQEIRRNRPFLLRGNSLKGRSQIEPNDWRGILFGHLYELGLCFFGRIAIFTQELDSPSSHMFVLVAQSLQQPSFIPTSNLMQGPHGPKSVIRIFVFVKRSPQVIGSLLFKAALDGSLMEDPPGPSGMPVTGAFLQFYQFPVCKKV